MDTTWKFHAMYAFRDRMASEHGMDLIVHANPDCVGRGIDPFEHGSPLHTDLWKTEGLKQALDAHGFDVAFGGARRDEERSRAKERVFSVRSPGHGWVPKRQRPELWRLYDAASRPARRSACSRSRTGPSSMSGSTSTRERIPVVPLYFASRAPVVERDGLLLMVDDDRFPLADGEQPE